MKQAKSLKAPSLKTPLILLGLVTCITVLTAIFIPHKVMEDAFVFTKKQDLKNHKNLKILSFASDPNHPMLKLLIQSSPYPVEVLGIHKKFRCYRDKLEAVRKYIAKKNLRNANRHHTKTIIMFVDGYDTFFTPGNQDIIQAFKRFDKPIVLSAETFCWPLSTPACIDKSQYPQSPTKFRYINSGTYIGYSFAIYEMLNKMLKDDPYQTDDQYLFHEFFLKHPNKIAVDYHQTIFSLLFQTRLEDYYYNQKTGIIHNRITGSTPIVLHGNGGLPSKKLLLELEGLVRKIPPPAFSASSSF